MSVAIDEEGLSMYADVVEEARTTSGVRRMIARSDLARDRPEMCSLEAQFASSGNEVYMPMLLRILSPVTFR